MRNVSRIEATATSIGSSARNDAKTNTSTRSAPPAPMRVSASTPGPLPSPPRWPARPHRSPRRSSRSARPPSSRPGSPRWAGARWGCWRSGRRPSRTRCGRPRAEDLVAAGGLVHQPQARGLRGDLGEGPSTPASLPVTVWPCGAVTVSRYGEVNPPLPNSSTICLAASVPGWPGSEKSMVTPTVPALAQPPGDEQDDPAHDDQDPVVQDELGEPTHEHPPVTWTDARA